MATFPNPPDGSVTTAKIANGAVTAAKVAADVATQAELDAAVAAVPEQARDAIGAALVAGSNVTITVNDPADTITIAASPSGGSGVPVGGTTGQTLRKNSSTDGDASWSPDVASVNSRTGAVTLTSTDVGLGSVDNTSDAGKPVSTAQATALAAKAPLASPALTGTPTAPTAAGGTNTTQLATTGFVRGEVTALINGAPGALDTLKEISDQLATDESAVAALVTTVSGKADAAATTTALAAKAPLASPALTGTPTAPTQAAVDNSTKLATTAYADRAAGPRRVVAGGSLGATPSLAMLATDAEPVYTGTLTANATLTITGLVAGQSLSLLITQDATGGRSFSITVGGSTAAVAVNNAAGAYTIVTAIYDGTDLYVKGA